MGERIGSGGCGQAGRAAQRQFGVDDGGMWLDIGIGNGHLHAAGLIEDDGEAGDLGTGAARSRNGNDRQCRFRDLELAEEVGDIAAIGEDGGNRLGQIEAGATADTDDRADRLACKARDSFGHVRTRQVGKGTVVDMYSHAGGLHRLNERLELGRGGHSFIGDEKHGTSKRGYDPGKLVSLPGTKQYGLGLAHEPQPQQVLHRHQRTSSSSPTVTAIYFFSRNS